MTTLLCMTLLAAPSADVHVAPNGRDSNPGTAARPFATLAKAQEAVRAKLKAGLTQDLSVQLAAGTYELSEPLVFTPADGGTEAHAVTWSAAPGATVVVSGGRRFGGWQPAGNGLWTAQLPDLDPDWYPRQLFVNGRRAIRARWPNADAQPAYRSVK
ncbi:MAG: hypothetical protein HYU66_13570, partial [Armatimonadetes bacterium]|nr:hypothetical protein [Armatimonadota bacterium]